MTDESWFAADVGSDFEESVRIDREDDGRDHRLDSIDTYHVTEESEDFMSDFFSRLLGRSEDMRSGANYWLYGYYGAGRAISSACFAACWTANGFDSEMMSGSS